LLFSFSFCFRSGLRKVLNSKTAAAASAASFDGLAPVDGGGNKLRPGDPHRPPRRETSPRCVGEDVDDESPSSDPTAHSVFAFIPVPFVLLPLLLSNLTSFADPVEKDSGGVTKVEDLLLFIALQLLVSASSFFSSG
jgi:hypothetical protein